MTRLRKWQNFCARNSGAERMIMGSRMFDASRTMILASLTKDLPPEELRSRLFERVYGQKRTDFVDPKSIAP